MVAARKSETPANLNALLLSKCIGDAESYQWLKYAGGTKNPDRFIASIIYYAYNNKVGTILLPYERLSKSEDAKGNSIEPDLTYESDLEFLHRSVLEQVGIEVDINYSDEVYRRETDRNDGTPSDHQKHVQIFYANWIPLRSVPDMKYFKGRNTANPEKGRPLGFEFLEAIPFMPNGNVVATYHLSRRLLDQPHNPVFMRSLNFSKIRDYVLQMKGLCERIMNSKNISFP